MENRYFQFLSGERQGEVVLFNDFEDDDDVVYLSFKDGSRCNQEFILPLNETNPSNHIMAEVESPNNLWTFKTEIIGGQEEILAENSNGEMVIVQPYASGKKRSKAFPPKKANFAIQRKPVEQKIEEKIEEKVEQKHILDLADPVYILMEKAKKFETKIEMSINILLPSKSLFNIANESFENGGDRVIEYIINNIKDDKIKDSLKISLKESYLEQANMTYRI